MGRLFLRALRKRLSILILFLVSVVMGPIYASTTGADGHVWAATGDQQANHWVTIFEGNSPDEVCKKFSDDIGYKYKYFGVETWDEWWNWRFGWDMAGRCNYELWSSGDHGWYEFLPDLRRLGKCVNGYKMSYGSCEPIRPPVQSCPVSHPVFPGSGVKIFTEFDESSGEELSLKRTYRSYIPFGPKTGQGQWLFDWHREIDVVGQNPSEITVLRGDGDVRKLFGYGGKWEGDGFADTVERLITGGVVTWRYNVSATGVAEIYDANGKLQSVQALGRRPTMLAYNKAEQLVSVTAPSGRALKFDYDVQGNVASVIASDGAVTKYAYNANGMLSTVTRSDDTTRQYAYEDTRFPSALTGVIDEAGLRYATYAYDDQGRAIVSELTGGADRYQFQYGADGQTTVLKPDGGSSVYSFLEQNGVLLPTGVSAPCPSCGKTALRSEYDYYGNATREVGYDGAATTYTHDAQGRETQRVEAAGTANAKTTTTEWHPMWSLPTRVASPGRIDMLDYDKEGRAIRHTWFSTNDGAGSAGFIAVPSGVVNTTDWTYNEAGLLASSVESKNKAVTGSWEFTYDGKGRLATVKNPQGNIGKALLYDDGDRLLEGVDADGKLIRYTYNARGAMTSMNVDGQMVHYSYNAMGFLTSVAGEDGVYIAYEYDAAHRLTALLLPSASQGDGLQGGSNGRSIWSWLWGMFSTWIDQLIGTAHAGDSMTRIPVPDAGMEKPKGDHGCDSESCEQSYLDCSANCIRAYDPLSNEFKATLTGLGGTFPKALVGLPRGLGGASSMTTIPSATAHALGGGGAGTLGGAARAIGRVVSPVWIGYGVYLAGMETYCLASCGMNKCAH